MKIRPWLILLKTILFVIFLSFVDQALAKDDQPSLVFKLPKQEKKMEIVKNPNGFAPNQVIENENSAENINIFWRAEFDYPWQGEKVAKRFLLEEGKEWNWKKVDDRFVGKTQIASCPVGLEYFYGNNQLKAKIYFTNVTEHPVENLTYKYVLEHPPDFKFDPQDMTLSKGDRIIELDADLKDGGYALTKLYDGNYQSAVIFSIFVGEIDAGEKSEAEVILMTSE